MITKNCGLDRKQSWLYRNRGHVQNSIIQATILPGFVYIRAFTLFSSFEIIHVRIWGNVFTYAILCRVYIIKGTD